MKDFTLITWLTQLGLTVALPLAGFVFCGVWLRQCFDLGSWVVWLGILFGFVSAIDGFRTSLKVLAKLSAEKSEKGTSPVSFNDHD
jgi:hypothetical protein